MGNYGKLGKFGGNFHFGYFDEGTRGDAPEGTNRGGAQRPAFKKLSKNPFKLRLVREKREWHVGRGVKGFCSKQFQAAKFTTWNFPNIPSSQVHYLEFSEYSK